MKITNQVKSMCVANGREDQNIEYCSFYWEFADGTICYDVYKAHGEHKDVYAVVREDFNNFVVYREHRSCCHIDDAYKILSAGGFGKWKTTKLLIVLRQALRERFAQGMPLEIPAAGIGERALKDWIRLARAHDTAHHGKPTF